MKKLTGIIAVLILFTSSCKKDELVECSGSNPVSEPNHTPMTIGDYWVYEVFQVDSNGNDSSLNRIDSMYISNDTLLNGNTYFVFRGTRYIFSNDPNKILFMYRDSSGYIVSETGGIAFSKDDLDSKFNEQVVGQNGDTSFYWYTKMIPGIIQYTVPAGTFDCLNSQYHAIINSPNKPTETIEFPNLYGDKVGLILETYGYLSQASVTFYERRLIRHQVAIEIP